MTRSFPAKILLFGEYGLIENSKGLTIPYAAYQGVWKFSTDGQTDQELTQYADYLKAGFSGYLDVRALEQDVEQGLYFDSTIPQGYGIGSSGALVAAVYDRYAYDKISVGNGFDNAQAIELKKIFSLMEGFFHGASSGIDPLLSYLNVPILIEAPNDMKETELPFDIKNKMSIFLLNSETMSKTTPMIALFKNKMRHENFADKVQHQFIPCNDSCIDAFLDNDADMFFEHLKTLSAWSLEHLKPMIPEKLHDVWKTGLDNDAFYLKLCGSGGGGFMLGFARDDVNVAEHIKNHQVQNILQF